ncbi:serine/threonine-protein phosphatase 2A 65 kDa regulatory subunit A beta isoform-like [Diorhabda carinulata]|uniref:serine/threonine-protein phosphatase 2A 65 kDa regulatory subunit A beta isoform-like n=1 Tax=Diorhabda carinulata TaxID=1163345 RepID=UPI0025A077EE|nr:serine/threonine-protein phosphatase 2A 65 kDa regulatory subunit A beta isoform-like [Diorhabda carinulata]
MSDESVLLSDLQTFKDSFYQAIREENVAGQVDMTKKLGILAEHLGQEITRTELLPFIQENIDFHDEILLNLSEQLKEFIPLVGGYEYSQPVLDLLRKICITDETVVREKSLETLKSIAKDLNSELTESLFLPLLETLANEDWFTSKCSAVALFPIVYSKVKEDKKEDVRHNFRLLSQDDSPIVRKAAAIGLVDLIPLLDKESIKNEFISVFDNIANDNMDSVRVHAIKAAIIICNRLTEIEIEDFIFKTLERLADSDSWKIRQVVAKNIAEIQEVIPFPKLRGKILAIFQKMLKNTEEEVRIMAVKNLIPYCKNLKKSYEYPNNYENNFESVVVQSIIPQISLLVVDTCIDVRLELAKHILKLSTVLSKQVFMEHVMPLVIDILELDTSVPVKANVLENLNDLPNDVDFAKSLPSIKNVMRTLIVYSQSHWRTRKGLLVTFMHIARFASKQYFSENVKIFFASLLGDPVFAVRRTAPIILPLLAKQYGMIWTDKQIIPYFKMFKKDSRYLYRYVPLFGINELLNPSVISDEEIKYLKSMEQYKEESTTAKLLWKLQCLLEKLKSKLGEKTFEDILSLNKSIDDFKTDTVFLYAGDTLTSLKEHYNQDLFACEKENMEIIDDWYLTGLVSLIYREFLELLLTLFDDKIVNVQIRSIFTLNKIKVFTDSLSKEFEEPWIKECLSSLSKENKEEIERQVDIELSVKCMDVEEENINTELMENIFSTNQIVSSNNELIFENSKMSAEVNIDVAINNKINVVKNSSDDSDNKIFSSGEENGNGALTEDVNSTMNTDSTEEYIADQTVSNLNDASTSGAGSNSIS